jgi:hypothetical protein
LDLGNLINGWSDDPVELHPFDFHFRAVHIIKRWIAVGFLPMKDERECGKGPIGEILIGT